MVHKGNYRRLSTNLTMNSNITEQVGHMLRFRVLQELELLADRLQCRPQNSDRHVVIRKLSRAEFREIRNTGIIPFENGVALLIVPPLNKDSVTKKRPESSYSPLPIQEEQTKPPIRAALPVSVLYPTQEGDHSLSHTQVDDIIGLPKAQIPLYNGVSLFPSRTQRAALYDGLNRLLLIERRARWRENGPLQKDGVCPEEDQQQEPENSSKRARGDQRASHAYLICSDAGTMLRADSAALAIALWRLRMWEGLGSMHGTGERDPGWRITRPKKLPA